MRRMYPDNPEQRVSHETIYLALYSPWQRGLNENTNGLLRQYLPKGADCLFTPKNNWMLSQGA